MSTGQSGDAENFEALFHVQFSGRTLRDHFRRRRMTIRLLIADDHEVVRTGLVSLMQGTEIDVIAEAANGHDAVRLARERRPDVALIDIRMNGGDGLDALEQ